MIMTNAETAQGQHFKIIVNGREKIVTQPNETHLVDVVSLGPLRNPNVQRKQTVYTVDLQACP
jgi:hypothetical protein